ncbi:S-layer homology domain-containing protein [Bacillus solitudinis]|uniref:S-layer homology domain-containing protein n=1 Tax=Bacillus solitudinis TaxID=2014074 RepID=UPI000C24C0E2|nr:S-layer homology domain-containing protein [Bacillus solitudinis]
MKLICLILSLIVALTFSFTPVHATKQFNDVSSDFWAKEEIEFLAVKSIIDGYADGSFKPSNNVTRAQTAIMIAGALELELENRPNPNFSDISEGFYAYDVVAAVADEGIILGRDGRFMPNEPLTRGQMAAILVRAFGLNKNPLPEVYIPFVDVSVENTFHNNIQVIAKMGITNASYSDATQRYNPNNETSRAQFSVFLARVLVDTFIGGNEKLNSLELL